MSRLVSSKASKQRLPGRAYSLAEVLVAMFFLTIAIFAVISVNTYAAKASRANHNREVANQLAVSQMSLVASILKVDFHCPPESIQTPLIQSTMYPNFKFVVDDFDYEDPNTRSLRPIRVRVFWDEEGSPRNYALSTTFYNY
jgi:hypothetical protein